LARAREMPFRSRIRLLPATALAAFGVVLLVSQVLGSRERRLLDRIETGLVPELELFRGVEQSLAALDQALQDAIQARDPHAVERTARPRDELLGELRRTALVAGADPRAVEKLSSDVTEYHRLAVSNALEILSDRVEGADVEVLVRDDALRKAVAGRTSEKRKELTVALEAARRLSALTRWATGGAIAIAAAVIAALAVWVSASVVSPLMKISQVAARISQDGDLTQPFLVEGPGEFAVLGQSFQAMMERLRQMPRTLAAAEKVLRETLGEASADAVQQQADLQRQVRALAGARSIMERASRARGATTRNLERVAELAASVAPNAQEGQTAARASLEAFQAAIEQLEKLGRTHSALQQRVEQCLRFTDTVRKLATGENDFALRLAVEASRLGAAGEEVLNGARELRQSSGRTAQAAGKMETLLQDLRRDLEVSSSSLGESAAGAKGGMENLEEVGVSLRDLLAVARRIASSAREATAVLVEQQHALDEIASAMVDLDHGAAATLGGLERTQGRTETLKETSRRLDEIVSSFRF